jgi:hypothetical protein
MGELLDASHSALTGCFFGTSPKAYVHVIESIGSNFGVRLQCVPKPEKEEVVGKAMIGYYLI